MSKKKGESTKKLAWLLDEPPIGEIYKGKTAILYASGPSLTEEVVNLIEPVKDNYVHFGCNDTYRIVPFLDHHYANDKDWFDVWLDHLLENCNAHKWTGVYDLKHLHPEIDYYPAKWKQKHGLSLDRNMLYFGSNSGFAQLNLAYHTGIRKFILVGYDMGAQNGKKHFFGDHPEPLVQNSDYATFIIQYAHIQRNIKQNIIVATGPSRLPKDFNRQPLEDILECQN